MKKLIVVALWTYLLGSIVGCSYSPTISQLSREIENSNNTIFASTSTSTATSTTAPTQTRTPSPTITPTSTPTATPTATPLIKQGNEVITRDNVDQLTLLGQIGKGVVYDIAWSADKKLIVLGTGIGIYIYNSATLVQEKFIQTAAQVISIDISLDNQTVISGNYSGEVELWDVSSGQKINHLHQWLYPGDGGANVAFSPDGLKMASIGMEEFGNYYMVIWDASSGEESQKFFLGDPFTGIDYFTFSTDGKFVAIGGAVWWMSRTNEVETSEKKIFIWDVNEEKLLQTLIDSTNERNNIIGAGFSVDNSTLWVAYSNNIIAYWDLIEEELIKKRELEVDGFIINYSQDGSLLAASENYSQCGFYEVENERKINSLSGHSNGGVSSLYFLDDKRIAAVIGSNFNIFDIHSGEIQSNYFANHSASVISPDGEMIALIDPDDTEAISLIDFISGNETFSLEGHTKRIGSLAFSRDQKLLASGGRDNKALLWDVETGNLMDTFNVYDSIGELVFSPNGKKLAVRTQKNIQIWDISLGLLESTLTGYYNPYSGFSSAAVFSPDGVMLASGTPWDGPIHLFYIPTGVLLKYIEGHTDKINSLAFSLDGSLLASASRDHSIRFWNIETGDQIGIIEILPGSINSIVFSQDGKTLVSGGEDGIIRFWGIP